MGAPGEVKGTELFPDISDEIDRRIVHSEQRIKSWVMGGILANLMILACTAVPSVFYLGQMSQNISQLVSTVNENKAKIAESDDWKRKREIWESSVEQFLKPQGYDPPKGSQD